MDCKLLTVSASFFNISIASTAILAPAIVV